MNKNIHYWILDACGIFARIAFIMRPITMSADIRISKETKTISKKSKNGVKMTKIMNKRVPTINNAFEFDFVEQKTHQITELFAFRANTTQNKSNLTHHNLF